VSQLSTRLRLAPLSISVEKGCPLSAGLEDNHASNSTSTMNTKVAFVAAANSAAWGAEKLWSRAAIQLIEQGVTVAASIHRRLPVHERVRGLLGIAGSKCGFVPNGTQLGNVGKRCNHSRI
jgi:hypothetical protein